MSRPWRHALSPALRNCTGQLATLAEGFQYRPIDSNVGTARAPFAGRPELGVGVGVGLGVGEGVGLGVGEGVGLGVGVTAVPVLLIVTLMRDSTELPFSSYATARSG